MNLLAALVPLGLAMMTGGGTQKTSGEGGMGLAESFLVASGAIEGKGGMQGVQPFTTPEMARPRTVAELTRGKPTTTPKMDPIQRIVQSDARVFGSESYAHRKLEPADARLFCEVRNPCNHAAGRRKTLATKQPGDIKVV